MLRSQARIEEGNPTAKFSPFQSEDHGVAGQVGRVGMNRLTQNSLIDNFKAPHGRALEIPHDEAQLGLGNQKLDVRELMLIQTVFHGIPHLGAKIPMPARGGIAVRRRCCG